MPREIAPILLIAVGALTGIVWTLTIGGRLNASPPYLFTTGITMAVALLLATRGAPRWGYPWMAMGIVGTQALMWALLAPEESGELTLAVGLATLGGPILAAVIGGAIATRSWGDSAFFGGLYLGGAYLALPIILLPPESGARTDIEMSRALLAFFQAGLMGAAVLYWNRERVPDALGALGVSLLISSIAAGILVPDSRADVPEDLSTFIGAAQGPFRIAAIILLISFAIGGARRFISGRGFLASEIPPAHATDDDADDEPDEFGRTSLFPASRTDEWEDEPESTDRPEANGADRRGPNGVDQPEADEADRSEVDGVERPETRSPRRRRRRRGRGA